MTARGFYTLFFGALMLFTALSVGSTGAFILGAAALFCVLLSLVSVLFALFSCRMEQSLAAQEVQRGERSVFALQVRLFTPLPIAPLSLLVSLPSGRQSEFLLTTRLFGSTQSENAFPCPHVGVYPVGVMRVGFTDCFGLFSLRHGVRIPPPRLTVLPKCVDAQPVAYSPGEGETTAVQRAQADHSTPSDIRAWQDGDELKRVHWKLSMRRQSLMVHTYETPRHPDALVLLNCAAPRTSPSLCRTMIDAMTEACAGVINVLLEAERTIYLPLSSHPPREISAQSQRDLPAIRRALAQEPFDSDANFALVLLLCAQRTMRTGSIVIISGELTPAIADAAIALARMGPLIRFTLVTLGDPVQTQQKLLHLLMTSGIEATNIRVG